MHVSEVLNCWKISLHAWFLSTWYCCSFLSTAASLNGEDPSCKVRKSEQGRTNVSKDIVLFLISLGVCFLLFFFWGFFLLILVVVQGFIPLFVSMGIFEVDVIICMMHENDVKHKCAPKIDAREMYHPMHLNISPNIKLNICMKQNF